MANSRKFSNVPPEKTAAMESCVRKVKAQGKDKEAAIAICFNSIVKKKSIERATKEYEMGKKRQAKKKRQRAKAENQDKVKAVDSFVEAFVPEVAEEIVEVAGEEIPEVEKDQEEKAHLIGEAPVSFGPVSWDELDELREAEKRAARVSRVSWDFRDLLWNIMRNPGLALSEKIAAIKGAADGVEPRVDDALSKKELKKLDAETLEIMLLSKEADSEVGLVGRKLEHMQRAKLTSEARGKLSDASFALVVERDGKTVRKYPIHDKAHVRNALSRAAQQLKAGGEGKADARAALPKIRAAAKRMGIGMPSKKKKNAIMVQKDSNGNWRWIGWVTNNFKDRDGDIIAEAAHKDYIDWLDETVPEIPALSPELRIWHTPGTARKSRVDWWSYTNGFLLMSGLLTEKEAVDLMTSMHKQDMGMSHGFLAMGRDEKDRRVITKYRTYEVSYLPLKMASNPWTSIEAELIQ